MQNRARARTGINTQTVAAVLPVPSARSTHFYSYRLRPPSGDGSSSSPESGSSNSGHSNSASDVLKCDQVAHVYGSFIVKKAAKDRSKPITRLDVGKLAIVKLKTLLDPVEFNIYSKLMFDEGGYLVLPYNKVDRLRADDVVYLVRCVNNSLHFILSKHLPDGVAKDRFTFEVARGEQKDKLGKRANYAFERERREVDNQLQELKACKAIRAPATSCKAFATLCNGQSKYTDALKALQKYVGNNRKSWEETCFDAPLPSSVKPKSKKSVTLS